jgi:hypothetical protein
MLDLPAAIASSAAASPDAARLQATVSTTVALPDAEPASPAVKPRPARPRATAIRAGTTIASGSVYRVSDGDTLSGITARVLDPSVSLGVLADAIQAANPDAFIRNDPNLIKLGSEILIPAATATSAAAGSMPAAPTAPVVPPAPAAMRSPLLSTAPEIPASAATPAAAAEALLPAGQIEPAQVQPAQVEPAQVRATPVARRPVTPKIPAASADDALVSGADEVNSAVAAGAGILFGLCISALLWFRGRLPSRKRQAARPAASADSPARSGSAAFATVVAPLVTRSVEPGFSVSYSAQYDDSLDTEFAHEPEPAAASPPVEVPQASAPAPSGEITSELEELFDGTDTTIRKRLHAKKTAAPRSTGSEAKDPRKPAASAPGSSVDFLVGELPEDHDEAMASQTEDLARPDIRSTSDSGTVDIHALAAAATRDQQQAQTLLEALTLLERDYEEELTASQVLDMSAVRKALGNDVDDVTQIGEDLLRKKVR